MWAQTYKNGHTYYREHNYSRSQGNCPAAGCTITCHIPDEQIGKLIKAIELGPKWFEEVLAIISLKDEVERIKITRQDVIEKLRRMAKAYIDGLFPDQEYNRQKRLLELQLESLVVPEVDAAREAGKLIIDLPQLWTKANVLEKR
jgi:site-specific DNA recombinase